MDLLFDNGSSQTLQQEILLCCELLLNFCSEFIFDCGLGGSSVNLMFYLILELIEMVLEILLLLLQELVLPLPEVAATQLFSFLRFLLLFPLLDRVAHDFDHRHFSAVRLSPSKFLNPGEASRQPLLSKPWRNLSIEFLDARIGEQRLLKVSLASIVLHSNLRFPHKTLNPWSELLGFMHCSYNSFMCH